MMGEGRYYAPGQRLGLLGGDIKACGWNEGHLLSHFKLRTFA